MSAKEKHREILTGIKAAMQAAPESLGLYNQFVEKSLHGGALDDKTKELLALGMAIVLRCGNCIILHVHKCKKAGITRAEIMAVFEIAVLMGGGPALTYATELKEALDEFYPEEPKK